VPEPAGSRGGTGTGAALDGDGRTDPASGQDADCGGYPTRRLRLPGVSLRPGEEVAGGEEPEEISGHDPGQDAANQWPEPEGHDRRPQPDAAGLV
jgi:hypothetical protein